MKKLFLLSNAHLDPVWLWDWQEGATAAIATFRAAADICEESEGFVFCHNEALLYQWVEEYDLDLFRRIQALVAAGKWRIMGGWFLQPDCNIPSGESILRQITSGQQYFKEKFGVTPTVAVNFDTFGHDRGMVQILKQCGYTGYLYMRPETWRMELPGRNFIWRGFDGSEILAHRLDRGYNSGLGKAVQGITEWCEKEQDDEISLFTWGVGNHGGGPSRVDLKGLNEWMEQHKELEPCHASPEDFFAALEAAGVEYPVVDRSLRPVFVGCYTAQARIKRLHRELENRLYRAEKLLSAAASQGLISYPQEQLRDVQRDMLFMEFHDVLPGTTIQKGEADSIRMLHHGLELVSRLELKGVMALLSGQERAKPEQTPVFLYNPHPYPVEGDFTFEISPADQNWSQELRNVVTVTQNGHVLTSQDEKQDVNMNLDWRKRITVHAVLQPSCLNRLDCAFHLEAHDGAKNVIFPREKLAFDNGEMQVVINPATGLVDRYCVGGVEYLRANSFAPVAYQDVADPWYMEKHCFLDVAGRFRLAEPKQVRRYSDSAQITAYPVRIVEDGPVRMKVEAEFVWNNSRVVQTYILPKRGTRFEIEQDVLWSESDTMLKLEIPSTLQGSYLGEGMFGSSEMQQDGMECVSQKWCGLFGTEYALTICNDGIYGSHCSESTISLSLMRSSAYAAHPIDDRKLVQEERYIARMDQGAHHLRFAICGGGAEERRRNVDMDAQILNEAPIIVSAFPSGLGEKPRQAVLISDPCVQLTAMYFDSDRNGYILRLFNTQNANVAATVQLPVWNLTQTVDLKPFRFQTYLVTTDGKFEETTVLS